MQKLKSRNPEAGYATDFVQMVKRVMPQCKDKGIKIVANAGGVNPVACRKAVAETIRELGVTGVKIAIVEGDDILGDLKSLIDGGEQFQKYGQRRIVGSIFGPSQNG